MLELPSLWFLERKRLETHCHLRGRRLAGPRNRRRASDGDIRELQRKYPDYQIIVGFINDDSHRDTFDHENNVRYLGGDCLFEFVFEKKWHKKVQKEVKKIVVSFYGEKKFK